MPPAALWVPAVLVAGAMSLPPIYLAIRTLGTGSEVWDLLLRMRVLETLGRTALLTTLVTVFSVALAVPIAWLTVRTDLPFKRMWTVLTTLPLVIPSYVGGFAVVAALGPRGLLQQALEGPFGVDRIPEIYGLPGATLILVLLSYPYVLLSVRAPLWRMDPSLEEGSRCLGLGPWATFIRTVLPQLRPAIAAGALLVALYTLSDFGAVSLLRYEVFTNVIYLQFDAGARSLAAASSLVLMAMALAVLLIEAQARRHSVYYRTAVGAQRPPPVVVLGRWRWAAFGLCTFIVLSALGMPLGVTVYWLAEGIQAGQSLGLSWETLGNSLYVSALAAVVTVAAALPVSVLAVRYSSPLSALVERFSYVGFALPGVVVALALVFFATRYATAIYQTSALLVFAYVILFLPAALGAVRASLLQVSPKVEEAARGLGRGPNRVLYSITLPLIRPGLISAGALVFLITMKELPATLILGPIGFRTLATSIWSSAESALFAQAAAPALLLVLASAVPLVLLFSGEPGAGVAMGAWRRKKSNRFG